MIDDGPIRIVWDRFLALVPAFFLRRLYTPVRFVYGNGGTNQRMSPTNLR